MQARTYVRWFGRDFFSFDILRKQIEDEFNQKMKKCNPRDIFCDELKENFLKVKFAISYLKSFPVLKLENDLINQISFGNSLVFINLKIRKFLVCMK